MTIIPFTDVITKNSSQIHLVWLYFVYPEYLRYVNLDAKTRLNSDFVREIFDGFEKVFHK